MTERRTILSAAATRTFNNQRSLWIYYRVVISWDKQNIIISLSILCLTFSHPQHHLNFAPSPLKSLLCFGRGHGHPAVMRNHSKIKLKCWTSSQCLCFLSSCTSRMATPSASTPACPLRRCVAQRAQYFYFSLRRGSLPSKCYKPNNQYRTTPPPSVVIIVGNLKHLW